MAPQIEVTNLYKSFGSKHVLNGINLSVEKGESLVIIGGSGSGKSVLLRSILGLIKPDSGIVKIAGQNTSNFNDNQRNELMQHFGMLFQLGALFDSLSVWENIAFGLIEGKAMNKQEAYSIALQKLKAVGLSEDVAMLSPSELSGGMQKRVSLARAIATSPEIILFDEPTTGLDPIMADVINDLIVSSSKELGATTVTITHDMGSARKIADKVAMLYQGKIIWNGTREEMDSTDNPYVRQFVSGNAEGPINMAV
jgi:phospholipid/cholesterol/gamma-HCH transport system ATP-binding protein